MLRAEDLLEGEQQPGEQAPDGRRVPASPVQRARLARAFRV
jgi:hypothetical protein